MLFPSSIILMEAVNTAATASTAAGSFRSRRVPVITSVDSVPTEQMGSSGGLDNLANSGQDHLYLSRTCDRHKLSSRIKQNLVTCSSRWARWHYLWVTPHRAGKFPQVALGSFCFILLSTGYTLPLVWRSRPPFIWNQRVLQWYVPLIIRVTIYKFQHWQDRSIKRTIVINLRLVKSCFFLRTWHPGAPRKQFAFPKWRPHISCITAPNNGRHQDVGWSEPWLLQLVLFLT